MKTTVLVAILFPATLCADPGDSFTIPVGKWELDVERTRRGQREREERFLRNPEERQRAKRRWEEEDAAEPMVTRLQITRESIIVFVDGVEKARSTIIEAVKVDDYLRIRLRRDQERDVKSEKAEAKPAYEFLIFEGMGTETLCIGLCDSDGHPAQGLGGIYYNKLKP